MGTTTGIKIHIHKMVWGYKRRQTLQCCTSRKCHGGSDISNELKVGIRISIGKEDLSSALGRLIWPQCVVGWIKYEMGRQGMSSGSGGQGREYKQCEPGWWQQEWEEGCVMQKALRFGN